VSELTEDLFEKVMDKFEKFAHTHNCNELTIDQIKELDMDDVPLDIIEVIHDHWHDKRQKKGIPLVRHFQVKIFCHISFILPWVCNSECIIEFCYLSSSVCLVVYT
jgi:hypothetical protein